jgi:hypothetical protein
VSAENVHGPGGLSNTVRVKPLPPRPNAPSGLSAVAGDGRVTLTWNSPGPNMWYYVYRRCVECGASFNNDNRWLVTNGTSWTDTIAMNGYTWEYKVSALNVAGEGPASGTVRAKPLPPRPNAPGNLRGSATGSSSLYLTWDSAGPNVLYWIYVTRSGSGSQFQRMQFPISGTSATLSFETGFVYTFYVTAVNQNPQESPPSNQASVYLRPPLPPQQPSAATFSWPWGGEGATCTIRVNVGSIVTGNKAVQFTGLFDGCDGGRHMETGDGVLNMRARGTNGVEYGGSTGWCPNTCYYFATVPYTYATDYCGTVSYYDWGYFYDNGHDPFIRLCKRFEL